MSPKELREYARTNGISLRQAKRELAKAATEMLGNEYLKQHKDVKWLTGDVIGQVVQPGDFIATPTGVSNEVEGIVNIQVFTTAANHPTYMLNTDLGTAYVAGRGVFGRNGRQEFYAAAGEGDLEIVVAFVAKTDRPNHLRPMLNITLPHMLARLPEPVRKATFDILEKIKGVNGVNWSVIKASESALGNVGLLPTKV